MIARMKTPLHIVQKIQENRARREPALDLREQSLLEVPPEIRELDHLEQLWLEDNAIQRLPGWRTCPICASSNSISIRCMTWVKCPIWYWTGACGGG